LHCVRIHPDSDEVWMNYQVIKAAVADAEANQGALQVMREVLEGDASRRALVDQLETEVSECRAELQTTRGEVIEWRAEVQRRDAELSECREEIESARGEVIEWREELNVTCTRLELAIKEAEAQSMYAKGLETEVSYSFFL
jgi:chromosome segregation ATPase